MLDAVFAFRVRTRYGGYVNRANVVWTWRQGGRV